MFISKLSLPAAVCLAFLPAFFTRLYHSPGVRPAVGYSPAHPCAPENRRVFFSVSEILLGAKSYHRQHSSTVEHPARDHLPPQLLIEYKMGASPALAARRRRRTYRLSLRDLSVAMPGKLLLSLSSKAPGFSSSRFIKLPGGRNPCVGILDPASRHRQRNGRDSFWP